MNFDKPIGESPSRLGLCLSAVFFLLLVAIGIMRLIGWLPGASAWNWNRASTPPATAATSASVPKPFTGFVPLESSPSPGFNPLRTVPPSNRPIASPVQFIENSNAERRARAKSRVLVLQQLGREIRDSLTHTEIYIGEWSQRSGHLLDGDDGRKLATQPDLVERFDALSRSLTERPVTMANVTSWREQLTVLLQPLVVPVENAQEVVMPSPSLETDLQTLQRTISERTKELRDSLTGLDSLLAAARDVKPGQVTLRQAVAAFQVQRQQKLIEAKVAGQRKADEATRSAIERTEQDKRSAEVALEVAKKNAVAAGLQKQVTDLNDAAARKQRLDRVRSQIQQTLQPFISPGYSQPRQMAGTFMDVTQTKEKKPMSLSGLRKIGAINDNEDGMRRLYRAASNLSNDRPKWSEAYNHELTAKAHELMLKYGEDMVAEGWLSP